MYFLLLDKGNFHILVFNNMLLTKINIFSASVLIISSRRRAPVIELESLSTQPCSYHSTPTPSHLTASFLMAMEAALGFSVSMARRAIKAANTP